GGDNIEILSPTPALVSECNTAEKSNDLSIVVRIHHAGQNILLPGDVEESAWDDMVRFYGYRLKSSFLKASHHGRDTGYHLNALRLIDPTMTFVSVGRKPDTDASYKYRQQTGRRTRESDLVSVAGKKPKNSRRLSSHIAISCYYAITRRL